MSAVPKTSPLGTLFFAHARRGECKTAPESAEHIYCKNLIALAAKAAGWTVTTERPGATPAGEPWIADVFCEKGNARLALEVQMSPQTHGETVRRQQRYEASGVRGAWFYGPKGHKGPPAVDRKTPAFRMGSVEVGQAPVIEPFGVPLPEFVGGMLDKRLVWTVPVWNKPAHVEYLLDTCWKCNKPVKQVYGYLAELDDAEKWNWHERPFSVASISTDLAEVLRQVGNEILAAEGLNPITERTTVRGKATNWGFTNLCLHCRAPQDNFHVGLKLKKALFGLTPDPTDAGYEVWDDERRTDPPVGLAPIARTVKGSGHWVFNIEPPG
ncbi:MAG: hypothetical protein KIT63_02630 [Rhodoferax sp.]|nr:hypothetical protein [Rhodoferax sp.]